MLQDKREGRMVASDKKHYLIVKRKKDMKAKMDCLQISSLKLGVQHSLLDVVEIAVHFHMFVNHLLPHQIIKSWILPEKLKNMIVLPDPWNYSVNTWPSHWQQEIGLQPEAGRMEKLELCGLRSWESGSSVMQFSEMTECSCGLVPKSWNLCPALVA